MTAPRPPKALDGMVGPVRCSGQSGAHWFGRDEPEHRGAQRLLFSRRDEPGGTQCTAEISDIKPIRHRVREQAMHQWVVSAPAAVPPRRATACRSTR